MCLLLLNESQFGAVASCGHAYFSLAHSDILVSSSRIRGIRVERRQQEVRGRQTGWPGHNRAFHGRWCRRLCRHGEMAVRRVEMDRKGNWRLKPQVADTLQRDAHLAVCPGLNCLRHFREGRDRWWSYKRLERREN